jgi:hypothetical protein
MVLLGDACQVKSCFYSFGDSVNLGARYVYGLRRMYHGHGKAFWAHPMVLLGDVGQVEAHFGPFRDSINLDLR